jgi:hypothetical protein
MDLLPQDVVVALKLLANPRPWTYARLGEELSMSASQVFRSVQRVEVARLVGLPYPPFRSPAGSAYRDHAMPFQPNRANLKEFLVHGAKYAFPLRRGGMVRGMPTAHAAPPLNEQFTESFESPPVWPDPLGTKRGIEYSPLYKNAPRAAGRDPKLYELLALVDAIRDGRAREGEIAVRELTSRINIL